MFLSRYVTHSQLKLMQRQDRSHALPKDQRIGSKAEAPLNFTEMVPSFAVTVGPLLRMESQFGTVILYHIDK